MATIVTLTVPVEDIIGADYDDRRTAVYIEANTPHSLIVVDGDEVRIGGRREQPTAGVVNFVNLIATDSADNPASFGYRVTIVFTPKGAKSRQTFTTSAFPLTASGNLAAIPEAWDDVILPVEWRSAFRDEMEAIRDSTVQAAAGDIEAAIASAAAAAVAADPTVVAAAASAVTTDLATRSVPTDVYYSRPTAVTAATTQTGTPTYTGGKLSGGVLKLADVTTAMSEVETSGGNVGTFCVELLATITAVPAQDRVAAQRDGQWSIRCRSTGNLGVYIDLLGTNAQIAANTVFTLNVQNHIALQFNAGVCSVFFNGVWRGDSAGAIPRTAENDLYIGGWSGNTANNWPGTVDALRITKGVLYPAHDGFTPPTTLPAPRTDPSGRAYDPSATLLHAGLDDANVRLSTGAVGYPAHPAGRAHYMGPVEPAEWLVADEWTEVTF